MAYESSFNTRSKTLIENIDPDDGVSENDVPDIVDFSPYDNPNISVDAAARFAVHEIIGGSTVRQKIGEEPTEVQIEGVCTEDVAQDVDALRKAKNATLISDRINSSMRCQIASTSTSPLADGGAADADSGDFLYEFNINMVEIDI